MKIDVFRTNADTFVILKDHVRIRLNVLVSPLVITILLLIITHQSARSYEDYVNVSMCAMCYRPVVV